MLDVRRLRLLREFADRGSIAATAKALGYTPSAVSQQLAVLEREVGTTLLDRTARSAELTDAGRRLSHHADRILRMIECAEADLSEAEPTGQIVLTAFPTAAVAFAPALAHSLRHHEGLTFQLRQTRPGDGLRQVRSGEVDLALVDDWTGRLPTRGGGSLRFSLLLRDPLVLVVPAGHWAADHDREINLWRLREGARRTGGGENRGGVGGGAVAGPPGGGAVTPGVRPAARRRRRRAADAVGV